jgi:hypothetical protein
MLCIEADNYTPMSDRGEVKSHVNLHGGVSGSAVGNNNQYVDTGLSYITRRRQGNKEVVGSWLGRLPASLGSRHVTATFHQSVIKWPAARGQGHA